mgnify:CR=1 FL=1
MDIKEIGKQAGFWTSEGMCVTVSLEMATKFAELVIENFVMCEQAQEQEQERETVTVTREMAMDAGDPSMEGHQIKW